MLFLVRHIHPWLNHKNICEIFQAVNKFRTHFVGQCYLAFFTGLRLFIAIREFTKIVIGYADCVGIFQ